MCAGVVSLQSGPVGATVTSAMIPVLIEALASPEPSLRWSACHSLARFGPAAAPAIPALFRVVKESAETDEGLDNEATPLLAVLVPGTPYAAEVIAVLTKALRRQPMQRKQTAASTLGSLGPSAAAAVPALVTTLREAIASHQIAAAMWMATALGQIDPTNPSAREIIPLLVEVLESKHKDLHTRAATAVGHFGPAAASAVPGLIAMLNRSVDRYAPYGTRTAAADALGRIAPGTPHVDSAVAALTESLRVRRDPGSELGERRQGGHRGVGPVRAKGCCGDRRTAKVRRGPKSGSERGCPEGPECDRSLPVIDAGPFRVGRVVIDLRVPHDAFVSSGRDSLL